MGGGGIETVKDGILNGYESLTVGQILDNYRYCTPGSQKWTLFETANGKKIVQFTCQDSLLLEASDRLMRKYANDETPLGIKKLDATSLADAQNIFQFSLHKDGEGFELSYSGTLLTWKDNKKSEEGNNKLFDTFYENEDVLSQLANVPDGFKLIDQSMEFGLIVRRNLAKYKSKFVNFWLVQPSYKSCPAAIDCRNCLSSFPFLALILPKSRILRPLLLILE